ncbi:tryptophan aminotransferase-related protein 2-like [Andrographis paniculata]|uniref:tryptophan aminotransferase-related protein 2-like n=1 Tax=Andrographis paniculata TaxID=175694 RepID=UPI0021E77F30|nr:tryptophan aminotransferase-related protein 2-like [Andrographis paniculata]XP_051123356.1 tryptophan aminotransferase-related protein 2-like [Andrographis paniculata]XP_051123357.1 tryptophan aminotransferase-related protein 2-like [Andrographis paniculata]
MELRRIILGHFLVISLALNMGLLYRDYYYNGNRKPQDVFTFKNKGKNASLYAKRDAHLGKRTFLEASKASSSSSSSSTVLDEVIDLDHGDPTMYERYWQQMGDKTTVVIPGWKFISYFSDVSNICWFLEPEFASAVFRLHNLVGNAATEDRHIVVGTGSTQLYQAVLYALSAPNATEPISVVSVAPFYSSYPLITDFLKSGLYTWAGDARKFKLDKPYIELVTSPNNPDGFTREPIVNQNHGTLVHDLAYYWPQYTAISSRADHDIMLFTVSKSTGHAGTRLGWALVKDREIAKKMTEFVMLTTIGVSKESQLRAAKILQVISDSHEQKVSKESEAFFDHNYNLMTRRWQQLKNAVKASNLFSLPDLPTEKCAFSGRTFATQPAFAWLKCEGEIDDCENFLRGHKIITRGGKHFGDSNKFVRISMLPRDEVFDKFIEQLSIISSLPSSKDR